ncbi:MAG: hypothetical protein FWD75_09975 [Propionibacteriaceae bacterium]|nr:hypothetical protein [Propionibacteriaceae bacterium]
MSLLRFASRSLLAGFFVADGLKPAINPDPYVEEAEPVARQVLDAAERYLPASLARCVPTKTATLVRIHGIVEVTGALMMATGIFRRAGAAMVVLAYGEKVVRTRHQVLARDTTSFIQELSLLGGVMLEAGRGRRPARARCRSKRSTTSATKAGASKAQAPAQRVSASRTAEKPSPTTVGRQAQTLRTALATTRAA